MKAFDKWWAANEDKKEIRKAIARCTHRNTLRWLLSKKFNAHDAGLGGFENYVNVEHIKEELDE